MEVAQLEDIFFLSLHGLQGKLSLIQAEKGFLEDMDACTCAMQSLTPPQREAVRCVYLQGVLNRQQQYAAVRYYATHAGYTDERTVYRWLQHARTAFAKARGLNCIVQTTGQRMQ